MTAQEIRNAYLEYAKQNGHVVIPRANLVPQNDPTTLFTGSGMQPLITYLLGEPHPAGTRVADSQTCLRAEDIEEVGDNRHTTFFEMLGNWSFGDYFKAEQLPWFFTFLTEIVGLDPNKLYVTAFIGDETAGVPKDTESAQIWQKLFADKGIAADVVEVGSEEDGYKKGMQNGRIFYYDAKKNWWSRAGVPANMPAGEPGGPDSEVFYEFSHIEHDKSWGEHCHPNCDCGRYMEIGNSVFMQYLKNEDGTFSELPKANVDFGGGLERIAAAKIDSSDMFKISVLWPIIEQLQKISGKTYDDHTAAMRVIADHLRTATFLAVDGVVPSNKAQGYVMRRFMRRAIRYAFELGIEQNFIEQIVPTIADLYHADYPEVANNRDQIIAVLAKEEKVFRQTLRQGLKELEKLHSNKSNKDTNYVFLHGFGGNGGKRWEGKLASELKSQGYEVDTPQLPNTDNPTEDEQVNFVLANCKLNEHTVLIGHSLGGAVAMKVLEKLESSIAKLILVAPAIGEEFRTPENDINHQTGKPKIYLDNFKLTYNLEKVKLSARERLVISDNQETQRAPYLIWLAKNINARLVVGKANKIHFLDDNEPLISSLFNNRELNGEDIFKLYDTYGFPAELSVEEALKKAIPLSKNWKDEFEVHMAEQKARSQTAAKGTFKGGLADHSEITTKYHTATHLMYKALRIVLGDHVIQRGSNITAERLRFDFSHPEKVTPEQIKQVEDIVNEQINKDWPMGFREENTKEALAAGVMGAFGDKYGEVVKVYTVGDPDGENYSREICGGPHVEHTGKLAEDGKVFKITKEEASSAGVRRIKAVLR